MVVLVITSPRPLGDQEFLGTKIFVFSDICTVRLDFESFITAGPTATDDSTACVDSFKVTASPSGQTTPSICGLNTGDHSKIKVEIIW